jgi:hypothetical protein
MHITHFLTRNRAKAAPTSMRGCLKFPDSIFKVSSFEIFFLTRGFSKTIFKEDPLLTTLLLVHNMEFSVNATAEEIKVATAMARNFMMKA